MGEISQTNQLNELNSKEWLNFTKSWFIYENKTSSGNFKLHPNHHPENLIELFIKFFTKPGQVVFDPFLGTGSTLVACYNTQRNGIGFELMKKYADIAKERLKTYEGQLQLSNHGAKLSSKQLILQVDSSNLSYHFRQYNLPKIDLLITSPPNGPISNQKDLDLKEVEDVDLANASTYEEFLNKLMAIFIEVSDYVKVGGHIVVILQNYMDKGEYKSLAWDFALRLKEHYEFRGEKIWCQENKTRSTQGYKYSFIPSIQHHYCLIFRKIENDEINN